MTQQQFNSTYTFTLREGLRVPSNAFLRRFGKISLEEAYELVKNED